MDHLLTEEQLEVKRTIRDFAENEIRPSVAARDESGEFPAEICKKLGELGFMGINTPEEFGGAGMDAVTYAVVVEELSRVDPSVGVIISVNNSLICYALEKFGTAEQQEKWLRPLAEGTMLGAFCLTEPEAGSDAAAVKCTAKRDGKEWVLSGTKSFITNGDSADMYVVFARSEKGSRNAHGVSAFLMAADTPGIRKGKHEKKMGIRSSDCIEIQFEDARIPAANLVGEEGEGFKVAMAALDSGRIGIAAQAVGLAQGALEAAVAYSKERVQFNRPICEFQAIQFKLADMEMLTQAARLLIYNAAVKKDSGQRFTHEAAIAKLFASHMVMKVTQEALQIHGGNCYLKDYPVERMLRDAKVTEIYEGTSEIQRFIISRNLLSA
ncbi:acyl-CoA dehydrogenase family protein [bacterium]|nr:acyl-CoA dehydrogenase family protein [bacterium]MBU1984990.1 acyl-CoA dehydrogenase family protein [bacterium]